MALRYEEDPKGIVQAISLACAFPFALLFLFGRIEPLYLIGARYFALLPDSQTIMCGSPYR